MTSKRATPWAAIGLLLFTVGCAAGEISCPSFITETPTVSAGNKDWSVVASAGERPLEQVGIYLGAPPDHDAQVPDATRQTQRKETVTWSIARAPGDRFWVGCSYVGTTALLFQELGAKVKVCVATYSLLASGRRQQLDTLVCR